MRQPIYKQPIEEFSLFFIVGQVQSSFIFKIFIPYFEFRYQHSKRWLEKIERWKCTERLIIIYNLNIFYLLFGLVSLRKIDQAIYNLPTLEHV